MTVRITLYSKARCHLCDVARAAIEEVRRGSSRAIALEVVDVSSDPALLARYRLDVPVVAVDGVERFRHRVDPQALASIIAGAEGAA